MTSIHPAVPAEGKPSEITRDPRDGQSAESAPAARVPPVDDGRSAVRAARPDRCVAAVLAPRDRRGLRLALGPPVCRRPRPPLACYALHRAER